MSQVWERTPKKASRELNPYVGVFTALTSQDITFFEERYGLKPPDSNELIFRADSRYAMPIRRPHGSPRGYVLRAPWRDSPLHIATHIPARKALTYMHVAEPVQSFYLRPYTVGSLVPASSLVLVEDQLSAIKLYQLGYNSVALLGVPNKGNIGADRVAEISRVPASEVIVALDSDATAEAFNFVRQWGAAFTHSRVAILTKDIKDTPSDEIREILGT